MWNFSHADFPANGSPRERLEFALQYASLAPTETKWRPWESRLSDTHLELRANGDPAREVVDPDGRESMIGCGSALLYLQLALKHFGCLGRVALFPDLNQPGLVARIHCGFCRDRDTQEALLFEAITGGVSDSTPVSQTPVPEATLASISQAVAGERGWLDIVQNEMSRQRVLEITLAGQQRWPNLNLSFARPGNATTARQTSRWPKSLFPFGGRRLRSGNVSVSVGPVRERSVPAATLAVVKTKTDDKYGWLAAGQTMARAVLQAQALDLSWAFAHPVRRREDREALRMGIGHKGFAQVILRFGSRTTGEGIQSAAAA
jgi:hypothetical protein